MKKLAAVLLTIVLLSGITLPVHGVGMPQRIRAVSDSFADELFYAELNGEAVSWEELDSLQATPGRELRIYLTGEEGGALFRDQEDLPVATADVTMSRLRAAQVEPEISDPSGVIESCTIGYAPKQRMLGVPYVSLVFVSRLEEIPFTLEVGLTIHGSRQDASYIEISGVLSPSFTEVYADSQVDLRGGVVALAVEDIPQDSLQIADDVYIYCELNAGGQYSGTANREVPGVLLADFYQWRYTLQTMNLDFADSLVEIRTAQAYYVYSADGRYLGTTDEMLPYADCYYLSNQRTS